MHVARGCLVRSSLAWHSNMAAGLWPYSTPRHWTVSLYSSANLLIVVHKEDSEHISVHLYFAPTWLNLDSSPPDKNPTQNRSSSLFPRRFLVDHCMTSYTSWRFGKLPVCAMDLTGSHVAAEWWTTTLKHTTNYVFDSQLSCVKSSTHLHSP